MYNVMKKIILSGNYDKNDVINKLDIFLAKSKITITEYTELTDLLSKGGDKNGL